ncbi:MAG: nucleotidyltransferase domain-containing protein [Candidatus Hadarchaeota archaeon]|nr:nucleotidyltransferase domain-containing protein [Candidatus Hadarchaeota archaeon]
MRFTNYFDEILNAKSDVKILRTLFKYPTKEFNENELARVSKVGQKTVNRAMPKYASYGMVSVRTIGKANVYTLNREHLIVKQLQSLFRVEKEAKSRLKRLLEGAFRADKALISIMLFGSIAKGEEEPTSDVDVFVLTRDKERAKRKLEELRKKVMERFGNALSEYILTPQEFKKKRGTPIVKEIMAHGELVLGSR